MKRVYEINDNYDETHWIVADSEGTARKLWYEFFGKNDPELVINTMGVLPDEQELTINNEDGESITSTAAQWAEIEDGFIGTTAFQ